MRTTTAHEDGQARRATAAHLTSRRTARRVCGPPLRARLAKARGRTWSNALMGARKIIAVAAGGKEGLSEWGTHIEQLSDMVSRCRSAIPRAHSETTRARSAGHRSSRKNCQSHQARHARNACSWQRRAGRRRPGPPTPNARKPTYRRQRTAPTHVAVQNKNPPSIVSYRTRSTSATRPRER